MPGRRERGDGSTSLARSIFVVGSAAIVAAAGVFAIERANQFFAIAAGLIFTAAIVAAAMAALVLRRGRLASERHLHFQLALEEQDHLLATHERELAEQLKHCEAIQQRLAVEIAERDDFIRMAAHDLGAPLRNISGMAAAVLLKHGGELSTDAARRLHRIRANADAQRAMVNDLLELSKLKAAAPRDEVVDLDAIVAELADLFENELSARGVSLRIDGQLPTIRGDRMRLRQVFQNLIDNAIKYMGDGPERLIRIGAAAAPHEVTCTVRDTGTGIAPADRPRLFSPFGRGRSTLNSTEPGMGLGLAGIKSIIENHGGMIRYDAAPGGGSVFTFSLARRVIGPAMAAKMTG